MRDSEKSTKRPNIVIFNPDSYRGDVVGHLGNPAAVTPHLDALIKENAVSFRNAFCQNPVCVPSRCSFMSGQYPHVHGHRTMSHARHSERDQSNLLRELKESGYYIWWGGKNDLVPGQLGHEQYCDTYFKATQEAHYANYGLEEHKLLPEPTWRGSPDSDSYYSFMRGCLSGMDDTEVRVDADYATIQAALKFLDEYDREEPLCMFLALSAPHPQYAIEPRFYNAIDPDIIPERISANSLSGSEPSFRKQVRERQKLEPTWSDERWRDLRRVYYGMCSRVDHFFGEVVEGLKKNSIYDDTALFFFSDHGDYTGDFGLVEKSQNCFEDCLSKVPFVVKPPVKTPVKQGVRNQLIELIDFTATIYEMAQINPPYSHFGKSLLPLLQDDVGVFRDAVFCEGGRLEHETHCSESWNATPDPENKYWPKIQTQTHIPGHTKAVMCRTEKFKYVKRFYEDDQLFDLQKDPEERHNRIHDPTYGDIMMQLRLRMLDWYMETCDVVPHTGDGRAFP